jgi:RNA polymerase sigma factor (sigma-70 family)
MSLACSSNVAELVGAATRPTHRPRNFFGRGGPNGFVAIVRGKGVCLKIMTSPDDDPALVTRLIGGDTGALRLLYEKHGRALLRFSLAMCHSRQAAEDIVHDTFVAFLRDPHGFDPAQGSVFGYLCGVLRHHVSRHFRRERRWVTLVEDGADAPLDDADTPDDEISRSEVTAAFRRAMLELPVQHREIIALCDLEELPYAAVAAILRCPIGTVRSRLHRARALLTLRLASLELIELPPGLTLAQEGAS